MNKNQGATIGAIMLAGLMLRPPSGSLSPSPEDPAATIGGWQSSAISTAGSRQGPWLASCKYWSDAKSWHSVPQPIEVSGTVASTSSDVDWELKTGAGDNDQGCGSEGFDRWGLPADGPPTMIHAIVATVPDPVHTHLALAFDRTIDAILQAAADGGFVSSYYWLPWKNHVGISRSAEALGDFEPGHNAQREREPGLIVLKHVQQSGFYDVIYLLLVAESPTQGVDGFQLQNAFSYEEEIDLGLEHSNLSLSRRDKFSRGRGDDIAIIGPMYSGSAASLRAGIDRVQRNRSALQWYTFDVAGATSTVAVSDELNPRGTAKESIRYISFSPNQFYTFEQFEKQITGSGMEPARVALLVEDNTALGNYYVGNYTTESGADLPLLIRFPREISMLRNAEVGSQSIDNDLSAAGLPQSPYLHLSLKDSSARDSVPQFSRESTPLSQESQLMTIARQLHRFRSQFIGIVASDVLDELFLAKFLHRTCPDATLVFFQSDLLVVREADDIPFVGAISFNPYHLIGMRQDDAPTKRAYTDSTSLAYYNATTFTIWDGTANGKLALQYYQGQTEYQKQRFIRHPLLWATTVGLDGYYPLAIVNPCTSDSPDIMPLLDANWSRPIDEHGNALPCSTLVKHLDPMLSIATIYPGQLWTLLCWLVLLLCLSHTLIIWLADSSSPFTRDLAIKENDQPHRRSMYIQIGTAMLFSMAFVVACPILSLVTKVNWLSIVTSMLTLSLGTLAFAMTFWKSRSYIGWAPPAGDALEIADRLHRLHRWVGANVYLLFTLVSWLTVICIIGLWSYLCLSSVNFKGVSFSFRALNPASGVCPLIPLLLLLFSWYLWAFFQTWRLRFQSGRPFLPGAIATRDGGFLFVSDADLYTSRNFRACSLFDNVTCLLIMRKTFQRSLNIPSKSREMVVLDCVVCLTYLVLLTWFALFTPIRSLDHILWSTGPYYSCPYEVLVGSLFFPLVIVALSGWVRMIAIWVSFRRAVLDNLEDQPIRSAFSRVEKIDLMTMLRRGGLHEHWQDIARSKEAVRQMMNQPEFRVNVSDDDWQQLSSISARLAVSVKSPTSTDRNFDFSMMKKVERDLAAFGHLLLSSILIPYWTTERTGQVEREDCGDLVLNVKRSQTEIEIHATTPPRGPARIIVAEEFLVIRYISFIRAVLTNLRYLMVFVAASFVLTITAWNSYPFQPRQQVDWLFTGLLLVLGSGVIWVFAQMYRNPILSRITATTPNELGIGFFVRIASFGALPVFAWLAYQFPDIGGMLLKFIRPGMDLIR